MSLHNEVLGVTSLTDQEREQALKVLFAQRASIPADGDIGPRGALARAQEVEVVGKRVADRYHPELDDERAFAIDSLRRSRTLIERLIATSPPDVATIRNQLTWLDGTIRAVGG